MCACVCVCVCACVLGCLCICVQACVCMRVCERVYCECTSAVVLLLFSGGMCVTSCKTKNIRTYYTQQLYEFSRRVYYRRAIVECKKLSFNI